MDGHVVTCKDIPEAVIDALHGAEESRLLVAIRACSHATLVPHVMRMLCRGQIPLLVHEPAALLEFSESVLFAYAGRRTVDAFLNLGDTPLQASRREARKAGAHKRVFRVAPGSFFLSRGAPVLLETEGRARIMRLSFRVLTLRHRVLCAAVTEKPQLSCAM